MIKSFLKENNNGLFLYYLAKLFSFSHKINFNMNLHSFSRGRLTSKLLHYRYHYGYNYYFRSLNLFKAYKLRLQYFYAISTGAIDGDSKGAMKYLQTVLEPDLINLYQIPDNIVTSILRENSSFSSIQSNKIQYSLGKVLMLGPSCNPHLINFDSYDHVIINKPVPEDLIFGNAKLILILNNQWSIQKKDQVNKWISQRNPSFVLAPQPLNQSFTNNDGFMHIPTFLAGASLMGLQRNLFLINYIFNIKSLHILGYNFSLSRNSYASWYPSLISSNWGGLRKGIVISSSNHDILLNFMYTRKFLNKKLFPITGDIHDLVDLDISTVFTMFQNLYKQDEEYFEQSVIE
tara:strand:- start:206 stop:1246 length:1041 start_codon:yes stop_codon:yes gene_type:complete